MQLERAFRLSDVEGDGFVSKRELFRALRRAGVIGFDTPEALSVFNREAAGEVEKHLLLATCYLLPTHLLRRGR